MGTSSESLKTSSMLRSSVQRSLGFVELFLEVTLLAWCMLPRLPPWIPTPSSTKEVLTSTRSLSRLPSRILKVPRPLELYWYMLEIFMEHDAEKVGFVKIATFPSMMHEFLATPIKHGLTTPSQDSYETLFKKYDPRNDGRLTVDGWMSLAEEEVYKKFL